ncbi:RNA polymerase sigma factor [Microbacterium amylolyticum]|uniref:RNA polymerase sigma-70 factor (ECF subfamily) n=1 Tax=Microbacterium amylolyticum TaxID=936337 RepID=A0ABS4ZK56_9MICO|nr:sigma-70 family RNA polymerase sigma factor [Microbacterium amylolyticum]MBP2437675.1 RNA polymerase sigma-70 factor (ECF subfamily) [Microbacterium amylolyticum]
MPDARLSGADGSAVGTAAALTRDERTSIIAALTRRFGDLDLAEDALQDATVRALRSWPKTGVPAVPAAWLMTAAKRRAIDVVRRDAVQQQKVAELRHDAFRVGASHGADDPADVREDESGVDDRLGLFFACAHPALSADDRAALMLRFLAGLTTVEVAHSLLVPVPTMQQRLIRAKKRIRTLGIRFSVPRHRDLPERLSGVLQVVLLMFSEGFARSTGPEHTRDDLTEEAIRLARMLYALMPGSAETAGLLSLLLLTQARRPARVDGSGRPVPLADQDRSLWAAELVSEGARLAEMAAGSPGAGSCAIQAAIAAVHAEAESIDSTDWAQIAVLYRMLGAYEPGPVVRLGHAIACGRAQGFEVGLRMLDEMTGDAAMARFRPFHIARATTLGELGQTAQAAAAFRRALDLPGNAAEDVLLNELLAELS